MSREGFTMKDNLERALALVAEKNPDARLVCISGVGLHPDGRVRPAAPRDWLSRWQYAFCDDRGGEAPPRFYTVLYLFADGPRLDENAGNVTETEPFDDETLSVMADSDRLVEIFREQPGFQPPAGSGDDLLVITMRRMFDPVAYLSNWKGQSLVLDPLDPPRVISR